MSEQCPQIDARRESPLAEFLASRRSRGRSAGPRVTMTERAFLGHVNLRGDPSDTAFLDAAGAILGTSLPTTPNTVTDGAGVTVCWLGPDEWLLLTPPGRESSLIDGFAALDNAFAAVTDLSSGQTVISIRGPKARDVLAKGCSLDLHPRVFGPGACAQTLAAGVAVIIRLVNEAPAFDIIVRRSFAEYLALWLEDASEEYGLEVEADGPMPA